MQRLTVSVEVTTSSYCHFVFVHVAVSVCWKEPQGRML